jgi:adenylate kinase family enzyme
MKVVLLGNAGAGKSTMARRLIGDKNVARLSLDQIAWERRTTTRQPLPESVRLLHDFISQYNQWIIEGCYGDLVQAALPHCSELRFLNPAVEVCVAHCRARPWEPEKFATAQEQQAMLETLIAWVRQYETREDEFGLRRHRRIFDEFAGAKREYTSPADY